MSETSKIQVDERLVKEIATLARLDLSPEEIEMFVSQFRDILDYVSILNEVDTEDLPPAYLSSTNKNQPRPDVIEASVPTNEFLSNAPQSERGYVKVPAILGED
jgi:aspartyl-tRNA(Asn)/glutamyl-tRNA(Gln) amidotransferase subunit C